MTRVLLVEDDASIRRFVRMALEDLPLELVESASLTEARLALHTARFDLLITDLMLPDGNGVELLAEVDADPVLRATLRRVVFSANVSAAVRARIRALGVSKILGKPVSTATLIACVGEALNASAPRNGVDGVSRSTDQPGVDFDSARTLRPPLRDEAFALHAHFNGSASLFGAFKASSHAQFAADIQDGDAALAAADQASLRRLAHSLKTVLLLLGDAAAAERAAALEAAAARPASPAQHAPMWAELRGALVRIRHPLPPGEGEGEGAIVAVIEPRPLSERSARQKPIV